MLLVILVNPLDFIDRMITRPKSDTEIKNIIFSTPFESDCFDFDSSKGFTIIKS